MSLQDFLVIASSVLCALGAAAVLILTDETLKLMVKVLLAEGLSSGRAPQLPAETLGQELSCAGHAASGP